MRRNLRRPQASAPRPLWEEMLPTTLCPVWLCFSERGLQSLSFNQPGQKPGPVWPVGQSDGDLAARLRHWRQDTAAALIAYFGGAPDSFDHLTLDLQGTPFQLRVWQALRQVPFGTITTYQAVAHSLGLPQGARAVGSALKANPVPIIIPCHRVVASNGSLGGYSAGLHYKRQLLSHEQVTLGKDPFLRHGP